MLLRLAVSPFVLVFKMTVLILAALGHPLDDTLVLDVVWVVRLNVGCKAVQRPLQCVFRGRVHHAWLVGCQYVSVPKLLVENIRIAAHRLAPMR